MFNMMLFLRYSVSAWFLLLASLFMSTTALGQREPGTVPFNFPVLETTTAAPGEYVLSPNPSMFERVVEDGGDGVLIWYTQTYVGPNETAPGESILQSPFDTFSMPNSLIIPLGPGTGVEASEGDILLSWWQTGSGMQRCYVVDATDPTRPLVKYLDLDLDNPATTSDGIGIGVATYQLEAGTFSVLSKATNTQVDFPPGSGAACRERGFWAEVTYTQIISTSADKLLGLGFAGRVTSYPIEGCVAVPVSASFAEGDPVFASDTFLNMREATIARFDPEFGRYYVVFSSSSDEEEPIAIGGLIDNLDSLPSTLSPTMSPTTVLVTPSPTADDRFPPECLTDLETVRNCLGANETTCLECWSTSLAAENPDGCDEGRELFCSAFSAACDELCGITCHDPIYTFTNCLIEQAQACGFEDPICSSDGTTTTTAPTAPPSVPETPVPTQSPTDAVSLPPSMIMPVGDDDEELPPECLLGFLSLLACAEGLGDEKGEPCMECWSKAIPENPGGCEEGRKEFCTAFGSCDCGTCKDQFLTLTNCIVKAAQGCGFEDPVCSDAATSGATSIIMIDGRIFMFLAMTAMQFVITFVL